MERGQILVLEKGHSLENYFRRITNVYIDRMMNETDKNKPFVHWYFSWNIKVFCDRQEIYPWWNKLLGTDVIHLWDVAWIIEHCNSK